jgi:hypothetical protein
MERNPHDETKAEVAYEVEEAWIQMVDGAK